MLQTKKIKVLNVTYVQLSYIHLTFIQIGLQKMSDKKEIDKERNRTKKNGVVLLELPFSFTCVLNAISLRKQYGIGIINESILYIYVKINIKSLNFSF